MSLHCRHLVQKRITKSQWRRHYIKIGFPSKAVFTWSPFSAKKRDQKRNVDVQNCIDHLRWIYTTEFVAKIAGKNALDEATVQHQQTTKVEFTQSEFVAKTQLDKTITRYGKPPPKVYLHCPSLLQKRIKRSWIRQLLQNYIKSGIYIVVVWCK